MLESHTSCGKVPETAKCYMHKRSLFVSEDTQEFLCPRKAQLWVLKGIIFISNLDYFISFHDCFLGAFLSRSCLLASHWWKIYSLGWNSVYLEATARRKPAEAQRRQHLRPPLSSQQARSSESGKEKQVGGKGCNLHLHQAGILFLREHLNGEAATLEETGGPPPLNRSLTSVIQELWGKWMREY